MDKRQAVPAGATTPEGSQGESAPNSSSSSCLSCLRLEGELQEAIDAVAALNDAKLKAEGERDHLREMLKAVTDHMDRAGGDRDGMPECPWCKSGPDGDDHASDCELIAARAALSPDLIPQPVPKDDDLGLLGSTATKGLK